MKRVNIDEVATVILRNYQKFTAVVEFISVAVLKSPKS